MRTRAYMRGFTLLEILIAVLLLAVGIVGGVAMQLAALRMRHQAALLSQATYVAAGLAERMRANAAQMHLADGANPYLMLDYDALAEPDPPAPSALCYGGACDSAQLALFDLYEVKLQVGQYLPAGRILVCRDGSGKLAWTCGGLAGAPVVVKVGWRGKNPDGTPRKDVGGGYAPAVAVVVGATR
ncbi:MAG: type IV pilus modification protein PilV [Pseudomonadota bacterium]